jgi:regulator of sigma E protease
MLVTLGATVLVLGLLIFVHELGHFLTAKAVGIAVPRFSIGFGPATPLRFRRRETEYVVSWIPLGGYVKMASQEEQKAMESLEGGDVPDEFPPEQMFESKSLPARILVISAGVIMNALFAWAAYTALAAAFGRVEDPTTAISRVDTRELPGAALPLADVPFGAQILRINGDTVASYQDILSAVIEPTSPRLRFDFAGAVDPVILPIAGTDARSRAAIANALRPHWEARVGGLTPGMPAAEAGLERGDLIVRAGADTVRVWDDLVQAVEGSVGDTLRLSVRRGESLIALAVVPELTTESILGSTREVGRIGIGPLLDQVQVRFGLVGAVVEGARRTAGDAALVLFTLKGMVTGQISPRDLGGPILIGQVSGQFARAGGSALLAFMAFLSVNLAILNLLPIPVLDGGHLVFLLIEGVRGKPLSLDVRLRLTQIGLFVLLGIMALALTNDLWRVFGG